MENSLELPTDGKGAPARGVALGDPAGKEEPVSFAQEDAAAAATEPQAPPDETSAPDGTPAPAAEGEQAPSAADAAETADTPDAAPVPGAEIDSQAAQSGPAAREAETAATVEAILFAADSPLPAVKVAQIARLPLKAVRAAIGALNDRYHQVGSAFRIEEIAGGFQMLTLGQYRDVLDRLHSARAESRLTQAALETLAVVAYRQPVLRADIESIRGVACGEVLRGLMEKQLIRIAGRAQVLGRPLLYGTTRRFLELFGLASLEDLPKSEELRAPAQKAAPETPAAGGMSDDGQAAESQTSPPLPQAQQPPSGQYIPQEQPVATAAPAQNP